MKNWKSRRCFLCGGTGMVSDYGGGDFNGPKECDQCEGKGHYWVHKSNVAAKYPGGPFLGKEHYEINVPGFTADEIDSVLKTDET